MATTGNCIQRTGQCLRTSFSTCCSSVGQAASAVGGRVCETARKVANFVKLNKWTLLTYVVSWALIVCSVGMMHGFTKTSVPFSVGFGAGMGLGLIAGFICASVFHMRQSIGGGTMSLLNHLDYTTRTLALTVFVAIYLIAAKRFPHASGGMAGVFLGSHIAVKGYWGEELVRRMRTTEERLTKLEEERAEGRLKRAEEQIAQLERAASTPVPPESSAEGSSGDDDE